MTSPSEAGTDGDEKARRVSTVDNLPESKLGSSGLGSQLDEFLFVLPTWGQHEYQAALEYATSTSAGEPCSDPGATSGAACLLRLDAVTTWEPPASSKTPLPETCSGVTVGIPGTSAS